MPLPPIPGERRHVDRLFQDERGRDVHLLGHLDSHNDMMVFFTCDLVVNLKVKINELEAVLNTVFIDHILNTKADGGTKLNGTHVKNFVEECCASWLLWKCLGPDMRVGLSSGLRVVEAETDSGSVEA